MAAKKNIYLVQVDILRKLPMRTTAYLPYAAGALWAYARQSPEVAESYALRELLLLRRPVDGTAARMEHPFFVGFSCSSWNTEYNKALAQAVKKHFPACHILFGGHNVPPGGAMLEELPYVDFLIHGEGEICLQALLEALARERPDYARVPGLSWRNGATIGTNPDAVPESVENLPSPYLEGVFSPVIAAHPEIQWSMVWETNRGCPNHCAFCDWGQYKEKVRPFSMERLLAEIEWLCANKIEYIYCADGNFGILPRDEALLDALIAARARTGYPDLFNYNTTKVINERVFRIAEKLTQSGLDRVGPNFAVQSLAPGVLRNIGRRNLDDETIASWIRRFRRAGVRTHTDLILGLPGETLHSFCAGVEKLYALGQHEGIQYFPCHVLPNAPMADPAYLEKHRIRTMRRILKPIMEDASQTEQIDEFIDMINETADMPHTHWLTANHFMLLAQGAHGFGLLRLVAMYLHTENIASYAAFYLALLDFCHSHPNTLLGETMARVEQNFNEGIHGREPAPLEIAGFSFGRMFGDQYFFGRAVLDPDRFYADAAEFLRQFVPDGLLAQLLRYQRESILLPGAGPDTEKTIAYAYDFPAYFDAIYGGEPARLRKKAVRLRFSVPCAFPSMEDYYGAVVHNGRFSSKAFYAAQRLN